MVPDAVDSPRRNVIFVPTEGKPGPSIKAPVDKRFRTFTGPKNVPADNAAITNILVRGAFRAQFLTVTTSPYLHPIALHECWLN